MAYKFKPRKSVKKRFRVTALGKLKHERTLRRHLLSVRSGDKKRSLARPDVLSDTHARNLRRALGVDNLNPVRTKHERALRALRERQAVEAALDATPAA